MGGMAVIGDWFVKVMEPFLQLSPGTDPVRRQVLPDFHAFFQEGIPFQGKLLITLRNDVDVYKRQA